MRLLIAIVWMAAAVVSARPSPAMAQGAVKIGFLAPLSGAIAQAGKDMYRSH